MVSRPGPPWAGSGVARSHAGSLLPPPTQNDLKQSWKPLPRRGGQGLVLGGWSPAGSVTSSAPEGCSQAQGPEGSRREVKPALRMLRAAPICSPKAVPWGPVQAVGPAGLEFESGPGCPLPATLPGPVVPAESQRPHLSNEQNRITAEVQNVCKTQAQCSARLCAPPTVPV